MTKTYPQELHAIWNTVLADPETTPSTLIMEAMQRAFDAGRDVAFKAWLAKLADEFVSSYGYTARQATEYVTDQPESWRDFFNDDYSPADAAHEDALASAD